MTTDTPAFTLFQRELNDALSTLVEKEEEVSAQLEVLEHAALLDLDLIDAESLLDRCIQIDEKYRPQPRIMRSIHHFACTGGSLISKCLHAMPGAHVLSEVHPLARRHMNMSKQPFTPTDMISASYYAGLPSADQLSLKIFEKELDIILDQAEEQGFYPIFREHTHTDYCVGNDAVAAAPFHSVSLANIDHRSIATVRNPIESYISLTTNGWLHHQPATFDEYCRRYLMFLENFEDENIFYYEDFVRHPDRELKRMCETLDLPFYEHFSHIFDLRSISGDSGRTSSGIQERPSRTPPDCILQQAHIGYAKVLIERLNYQY